MSQIVLYFLHSTSVLSFYRRSLDTFCSDHWCDFIVVLFTHIDVYIRVQSMREQDINKIMSFIRTLYMFIRSPRNTVKRIVQSLNHRSHNEVMMEWITWMMFPPRDATWPWLVSDHGPQLAQHPRWAPWSMKRSQDQTCQGLIVCKNPWMPAVLMGTFCP